MSVLFGKPFLLGRWTDLDETWRIPGAVDDGVGWLGQTQPAIPWRMGEAKKEVYLVKLLQ